jgi:hypothetical protein
MAELSAYYEAFGYQPEIDEAADHLSVQLGFIGFLKMKLALALIEGETEKATLTERASNDFLREHIAIQAEPVLHKMQDFGPEFLVDAARLAVQYAGPSPRSQYPLGADPMDDTFSDDISCGPAPSGLLVTPG